MMIRYKHLTKLRKWADMVWY